MPNPPLFSVASSVARTPHHEIIHRNRHSTHAWLYIKGKEIDEESDARSSLQVQDLGGVLEDYCGLLDQPPCEVPVLGVDGVANGWEVFDVVAGPELWTVDGVLELCAVGDLIMLAAFHLETS
jgi:hypothetical protein